MHKIYPLQILPRNYLKTQAQMCRMISEIEPCTPFLKYWLFKLHYFWISFKCFQVYQLVCIFCFTYWDKKLEKTAQWQKVEGPMVENDLIICFNNIVLCLSTFCSYIVWISIFCHRVIECYSVIEFTKLFF